MPWPMVHFAIAEKMYAITNVSPAFLLGSIAPDAIHTRINCTRKDKGFTHLISEDDQMPNVGIIMENCLRYLNLSPENEWKQFILGYFSHIYADLRWTETVYAEFELMYIGELQEKRKTYNTEVNQIVLICSIQKIGRKPFFIS